VTKRGIGSLHSLEGRQVGLALVDGSRIDDATLVSARAAAGTLWLFSGGADVFVPAAARAAAGTLWLFSGGADVFVPAAGVIEAWEWPGGRRAA